MWQLQKGTHCGLPAPIHPNAFDNFKGEKNRNNIFYVSVSGDLLQKVEWMMKENQNWWSVVADLLKNYSEWERNLGQLIVPMCSCIVQQHNNAIS